MSRRTKHLGYRARAMGRPTVTFAVVGHNEAATLANATLQAMDAAGPGDRVWFVDSASSDGSAEIAAQLGAEVIPAPLGKGRAVAEAINRCDTSHICFLDGDLESSSANIPLTLRRALADDDADMIVAEFSWPAKLFAGAVIGVYRPLVSRLFPEALDRYGAMPFSGFRILRSDLPVGSLPSGFGLETYLNVLCAVRGLRTGVVDVGVFNGPVRTKPELGLEVAQVLLDMATAHGRLDERLRPEWDAWVAAVMEVLWTQPEPDDPPRDYPARLAAVASRPTPATSR
jgi:hypothetical protein